MLYVITGGSGSGKSEFAENTAVDIYNKKFSEGNLYYCATMIPYDAECDARIERHREMRKNKGFTTVECYCGIGNIECSKDDVVLIECMSNLTANEMYSDRGSMKSDEDVCYMAENVIIKGICDIEKKAGTLVVVTNEVFDDICFDSESLRYIRALGYINRRLAEIGSKVYEVVCGIPVEIKK